MDTQRRTSLEQLLQMVTFLEQHKYLASGKLRSKEQAALSTRLWSECAKTLNAEGDTRTPKAWKKYFNQYKSRLLARIRRIRDIEQGKYSACTESPLTELEERFAAVCDFETGSAEKFPKLMLEINPLKQTNDRVSVTFKDHPAPSFDSEPDVSIESDNEQEEKAEIYQSEPKIMLHEGMLTVNDPGNHLLKDSIKEKKPVCQSEPKLLIHESNTVNIPEKTISRRLRKRRKSDVDQDDSREKEYVMNAKHLEVFGQNVGMKLQALQDKQRIIVEKIINDALFLAETESLTMNHAMTFAKAHRKSKDLH